jgi:Domain of unknown function (DUF5666)
MMVHAAAAVAAVTLAVAPVQGSVFGPVVAVKGSTFTITTSLSPSGKSLVTVGSARITEQATASRSSLKAGACVAVSGTRNAKGVVAATRISVSEPVKGQCQNGFRRRGARPIRPANGQQPPAGSLRRSGTIGFAIGSIAKLSGSTLTVKGRGSGTTTTTVTVSAKTLLTHTVSAKASAVTTKLCAFVQGTSADKGVTVKATAITLTPRTNGQCVGFTRQGP